MLVFTFQQVAGYRSEACVSGVLIVTALSLSFQLPFVFITVDVSSSLLSPLYYPLQYRMLILLDPFDPCVWGGAGGFI